MIIYLVLVFRLVTYLKRVHASVWIRLGRPWIPNFAEHANNPWPFVESGFRTGWFVFSNQYKELQDRQVTSLIRMIWITLAANAALFAMMALT
jgi:hypothetical protein